MQAFLQQLRPVVESYKPSEETAEFARCLAPTTISGPSGSGKDTLMRSSGLAVIKGHTTKPQIEGADDYTYVNSEEERDQLLADIDDGKYVQVAIHPTTGHFYGISREDCLVDGPAVLDIRPAQVMAYISSGLFGAIRPTYVGVPDFETWQHRLRQRGVMAQDEYAARMQEAADSIRCALLHLNQFYFVLNDTVPQASNQLRDYATEGQRDDPRHHQAALATRSVLNELVSRQLDQPDTDRH
ncbi:hypothetical protein KDA23_03075 [Candidatus Saccharibacteria bacterium]|nr:hypothetical protein [Candidatus Saccharibacteria bacterium]